jgi:hypothetical protein
MMTLYDKIKTIYPQLEDKEFGFTGTIHLQNDGQGDYIKSWSHPTYAEPTQAQLNAIT